MKKTLLVSLFTFSLAVTAQDVATSTVIPSVDNLTFNKWSIELNGGVNKPTRTMSAGYSTASLNLFHADLGARYMFNPKFGLKLDFGYDKFQERDGTAPFESIQLRTSLQGVINLGRALNFEDWTNTFGLLFHGGFGVSQLTSKSGFDGQDYAGNGLLGMTGQIKLSDRVVLTGDLTGIVTGKQNQNFDGMSPATTGTFDGLLLNASVGLTFYLGKNTKHADWVGETDKYDGLDKRVKLIEDGLLDTDKDGVADLYDLEPNSIAGVAVNTKGQSIDTNQNGVPDELESYLAKTYGQNGNVAANNNSIEELINGGYVNVYFDFNSTKPTTASLPGVAFLVKYLQSNPSKNADIIGYADEIGTSGYNTELSRKRAEAVKQIAVNSGIDASRLNVIANGEDASVNKNSKEARQIVRRVTFQVK
jgi:OOP family OmpA-OmpF porin